MAEDSEMSELSLMDISKLKVQDLKKELKLRGLSTTGNKNELSERLQNALNKSDIITSESVDDLEEDLLNDDDDEHLDASESVILENDLDESPKAPKRKIDDEITKTEVKSAPPKKVILNRHTSIELSKALAENKEKDSENDKQEQKEEKKVIKLSSLSAKERLEMRAKKFGVTDLSSDAKKLVRAERFSAKDNFSPSPAAISIKSPGASNNIDVLKQRAERFGGSVSSVMSSLENQEKLEKRKARFGSASSTNGTSLSETDKAKQRLERFKQPVA